MILDPVQALGLAQKHGSNVKPRSEKLPFLYQAGNARCVYITNGAVSRDRGPSVAGAYLRSLGLARGEGPQIDDVLWALWALEALPQVDSLHPEAYVSVPGDERLRDLTARLEHDGTTARVVLHYFLPEGASEDGEATGGRARGGGSSIQPLVRPVARLTFSIIPTGDATWTRDDITFTEPR